MMRALHVVLTGLFLVGCPPATGDLHATATADQLDKVVVSWTVAARLKPAGFRVLRDGTELASLPADARSYEDPTALPGTLGPPREVSASQGTTPAGVLLQWKPSVPAPGPTHSYRIVADVDAKTHVEATAGGSRAAPTAERYELARDSDPAWVDAGAGPAFTDAKAPMGGVSVAAFVNVVPDPPRRAVVLRVRNPRLSVQGAPTVSYRLRAVAGAQHSSEAEVTGYRLALNDVAQLHIGWQRSTADTVFAFDDLPGVSGQDALDDSLAPGVFRYYRPVFTVPGAAPALGSPTRIAVRPVTWLSSMTDTTCAVDDVSVAVCWGGDEGGKRAQLPPALRFKAVVTGELHGCGITNDDHVACWGNDDQGQAPTGPSPETFLAIAAGSQHTCGVQSNGQASCWGANDWGQATPPPTETFSAIAAWGSGTCGVTSAGRLRCWGATPSPPTDDGYVAVTLDAHGCALKGTGEVVCWGANGNGQSTPPAFEHFGWVSAGDGFTCGVRDDSVMRCWGAAPAGVPQDGFAQVSAGGQHACGVKSDGTVRCWGANDVGQAPATPPMEPLVALSASGDVTCALRAVDPVTDAGHALCLGALTEATPSDLFAQVRAGPGYACGVRRDGSATCWSAPAELGLPPTDDLVSLAPGRLHVCAIRRDKSLVCWGANDFGQATPPASDAGYSSVVSGSWFSCALRDDGVPDCWGGTGGPDAGSVFTSLAAGEGTACGLKADGHGECWGNVFFDPDAFARETFSSLAVGGAVCGVTPAGAKCFEGWYGSSFLPPPVPQRFPGIAVGASHVCALKDDARLVCWGGWADGAAPRP